MNWDKFINPNVKFHFGINQRSPRIFCDNCDAIVDEYFTYHNTDICMHCFVVLQKEYQRFQNSSIKSVDWDCIDWSTLKEGKEVARYRVVMKAGTVVFLTEDEIEQEDFICRFNHRPVVQDSGGFSETDF